MNEAVAENELLPVRQPAEERHRRLLELDQHPYIDVDARVSDIRRERFGGLFFDDRHRIIGLLVDGQCPVCGARGTINVQHPSNSFKFIKGVENRVRKETDEGQSPFRYSETVEYLEDRGYHPVVCTANSTHKYLIGVASPTAHEAFEEWKASRAERQATRHRARSISTARGYGPWIPDDVLDGKWDHGDIIAGMYELLGAESYETMDLAGRTHVRKTDLAVLLDRIRALERTERTDYSAEDWLAHREFGITNGRVQWHVPEWVDAEGPEWKDEYRRRLFE